MGRFYLRLKTGNEIIPDDEGSELPDVAAATSEALQAARELLAEAIKAGRAKVPDAILIADEAGRMIEVLPLTAVLPDSLKK
jgi:hypothetical protein